MKTFHFKNLLNSSHFVIAHLRTRKRRIKEQGKIHQNVQVDGVLVVSVNTLRMTRSPVVVKVLMMTCDDLTLQQRWQEVDGAAMSSVAVTLMAMNCCHQA